jgi:hypothetical protein
VEAALMAHLVSKMFIYGGQSICPSSAKSVSTLAQRPQYGNNLSCFYFYIHDLHSTDNNTKHRITEVALENISTMEKPWQSLSELMPNFGADDSDEEGGGEYSRYKTTARRAFASPSSLAGRLGKRVGANRTSSQSVGASSRRCKNLYRDHDAADILKQINGSTGIGKTSATTEDAGLAEFASAKGIVLPNLALESTSNSIVEKSFEQHRDPIGMVITGNSVDDVAVDDKMTLISEDVQ